MSVKLLVICHGAGVDEAIIPTGQSTHPEASFVHAAYYEGWTVIAPYAHGDGWGNAQQMTDIANAITLAQSRHAISKTVVQGTSMGGTTAMNAIRAGLFPNLAGAYFNDAVVNVAAYHSNTASGSVYSAYGLAVTTLAAAASLGATSLSLNASYPAGTKLQLEAYSTGKTEIVTVAPAGPSGSGPYTIPLTAPTTVAHSSGATVSDEPSKVGTSDPMVNAASAFPNIRYRFALSDADTTALRAPNGDMMATKLAAKAEASVLVHNATHASSGSYWPEDFVAFLRRC